MIVGVDAGGSHTELAIAAAQSPDRVIVRVSANSILDTGSVASAGSVASPAIGALLRRACAEAAILLGAVRAWAVGAAGVGRDPQRSRLEAALRVTGVPTAILVTDQDIALRAAFGAGPGIVVAAGTGSFAVAQWPDGTRDRVGGWGPLCSDEGSAYRLGVEALTLAVREADGRAFAGREGEGGLLAPLLEAAGVADFDALLRWSQEASRAEVAALAVSVDRLAAEGLPAAGRLVGEAAASLHGLVRALADRFPGHDPIEVALAGGALAGGALAGGALAGGALAGGVLAGGALAGGALGFGSSVAASLITRLRAEPRLRLHAAPVDPVIGALRLAAAQLRGLA